METQMIESPYWDVFSLPVEDNSTEEFEYNEYKETNVNVSMLDQYEFYNKDMDTFLLPSRSYIQVKGKILKEDTTAYPADTTVALVNNGFSIFKTS